MLRKLPLAMAIALAVVPYEAYALAVGNIVTKSVLNQKFDGEIKLLSVKPGEIDSLKVSLASSAAFARAGVERPFLLSKLRFKAVRKPNGEAVILVRSRTAIQEPFLNFLLEVNWPNGRLVREFTVLLDPPVMTGRKARAVNKPEARTYAAPATKSIRKVTTASSPSASMASGGNTPSADTYGPVKHNETLWAIANRYRSGDVTVQQMMLAMLEANPEAFATHNINTLKAGVVLRIPTPEEVRAFNDQEARLVAANQFRDWKNQPAEKPQPVRKTPEAQTEPETAASTESIDEKARLKLSGVEAANDSAAVGSSAGNRADEADPETLKQELLAAREEIETSKSETEQIRGQMDLLQEQLNDMKRLLELKDQQLAQLQNSQAETSTMDETVTDMAENPAVPGEDLGTIDETADTTMDTATVSPEPAVSTEPEMPSETAPEPEPSTPVGKLDGWIKMLTGSATVMGIAIAVIVVLLALIWTAFSRRRTDTGKTSVVSEADILPDTEMPEEVLPDESNLVAAVTEDKTDDTSFLSEFSPGDMNAFHEDETGEVDPVSEADVYIAYGRFDQAEELVNQALEHDPGNVVYQHKLLEVFYANRDVDKYTAQIAKMLSAGSDVQDAEAWNRAKLMGQELDPDNPLFSDAMDAPSIDLSDESLDDALNELESQLTEDLETPPVVNLVSEKDETEADEDLLSLDLDSIASTDDIPDKPVVSDELPPSEDEIIPLPEFDSVQTEDSVIADDESSIEDLAAELDAISELGSIELEDTVLDAPQAEDDAVIMPDDISLDEEDMSLSAFAEELNDVDSASTKIDLAKAYIDMGDSEGARAILTEVLNEGSKAQKQEVEALLASLG